MPFGLGDGVASNYNREIGVRLYGTGCYQLALYEQNGILVIDTIVPFFILGETCWDI